MQVGKTLSPDPTNFLYFPIWLEMVPYEPGNPDDMQVEKFKIVIFNGLVKIWDGFEMAMAGYGTHIHEKLK